MFSQNSSNYNPAVTVNNIDTESYNWKKIAMIIFAVLLVVMLILIVIHYTITPIFKTTQGSKGYIPVPGITLNDGHLYWKSPLHDELKESDTILKGDKGDMPVTFQMDVLKNPPLQSVGFIFGNPGTAPGGVSTGTADNSLPNCQVTLSQQFKQAKDTTCSPTGSSNEYGGIMNLYVWQRVLNADEMRYSGPKMPSADDFKKSSLGKSYFNLL